MSRSETNRRPTLESLEERLNLSSFYVTRTGQLVIYGDNGHNTVSVSNSTVQIDGSTYSTSRLGVTQGVFFYGYGGADKFYNMTSMYSVVYGGSGNDRISGGYGQDWLYGEGDHDNISGQSGTNVLDGGSGDDRIYGGEQIDYILGGAGRDVLYGYGGTDYIWGATQNGSDRDYDYIDGGSGRNGAKFDQYDRLANIHFRVN